MSKVRRGCTLTSQLTWPSTKKCDGTEKFAMTDSVDGCSILPEIQFCRTRQRMDTIRVLSVGGSIPPMGAAREKPDFDIKPPLGVPLLIFTRGYLLKSFPQGDTSARQRRHEIRDFPLLGELPKAIESHLPVCQLYLWKLNPNKWSTPTTISLDPIVVTALRVVFPVESLKSATYGFACNCQVPEAWTTEASGHNIYNVHVHNVFLILKYTLYNR